MTKSLDLGAKNSRLERGAGDPRLLRHRFAFPRNEKLRSYLVGECREESRYAGIQEIFLEVQAEYPELVGFAFFGSYTKGYAEEGRTEAETSDIDAYVFVDASRSRPESKINERLEAVSALKRRIHDTLGIPMERLTFERKRINWGKLRQDLGRNYVDLSYLAPLFLLSVGNGLVRYRKWVLDFLESRGTKEGENGFKIWEMIMDALWKFENSTFFDSHSELALARRSLYPKLSRARRYFNLPKGKLEARFARLVRELLS